MRCLFFPFTQFPPSSEPISSVLQGGGEQRAERKNRRCSGGETAVGACAGAAVPGFAAGLGGGGEEEAGE